MDHHNIGPSEKRSVLLQFLEREVPNPVEFLAKIDRDGFDEGDKVIGV